MRRGVRLGSGLVAGALVVVGGTAVGVRAATAEDGGYRTAAVVRGDVEQTVAISGTVDATQRDDVAAAVDGTVSAVRVETGERVRAGQVVARLDRTDAERALRRARAAVDAARVDLRDAADGQSEVVETATAAEAPTSTATSQAQPEQAGTGSTGSTAPESEESQPEQEQSTPVPQVDLPSAEELTALQGSVTEARSAADAALAQASAALDAQTEACAAAYGRAAEGEADTADQDALCDAALAAVETAQQEVAAQQATLDSASDALVEALVAAVTRTGESAAVLEEWVADQAGPAEQPTEQQPVEQEPVEQEPAQEVAPTATTDTTSTTDPTPTTETQTATEAATSSVLSLSAAQAALDGAQADLVQARSDLAATRVLASRAGTVTDLGVAAGDTVTAGDVVAVVVGRKGATVTAELSSSEVADLAVGQDAEVTLPGSDAAMSGEVTWVSRVSTTTETTFPGATTASYAVEVAVPAAELGRAVLPQGARADATVVVGTTEDALVVPTSALSAGASDTVRVLDADGTVSTREVEVARTGDARTAVRSGLEEGDVVVLADLDAEVDAAGEVSSEESGFPGGMVGGGGMPPGGNRP